MGDTGSNGKSPFNPEGIGFEIGGNSVTLTPIKIRGIIKIAGVINKTLESFSKASEQTQIEDLVNIFAEKYCEIMEILFPYKFMTQDFIKDNMTLVMARKIIETAIDQNGLADIFPFLKKMISKPEVVATSETKIGA